MLNYWEALATTVAVLDSIARKKLRNLSVSAEQHSGTLELESDSGGCRFVVTLPVHL